RPDPFRLRVPAGAVAERRADPRARMARTDPPGPSVGWRVPRRGGGRSMTKGILERLVAGTVLGDGGYLLELEKRGYVQAGPFTPEVVIEHPDALAELHREFLLASAD